jgi:mono/diheme cytochrome c family protein
MRRNNLLSALAASSVARSAAIKQKSFDTHQSIGSAVRLCWRVMNAKSILRLVALTIPSALAAFAQNSARPSLDPGLAPGKQVYDAHCAACHGSNGDGNGPASVWLFPKPRNFNSGLFKIQSTPVGSLPSDDDLFETITRGMPGSSMPSFTYLSEHQRREVVPYVKGLAADVDASGKRINKFDEARARGELKQSVVVPPEPGVTVEALTQGKEIFTGTAIAQKATRFTALSMGRID